MLYDDANQVEVRYVISLAHHDVGIYGGEGIIPEGELWLKRNAISLSRRLDSLADLGGPTPPFYLFSDNLSEKEDFYFAMLQNQTKMLESSIRPPKWQHFDTKHIVALVQRLHSSEEHLQTRWINAILGRLFLAMYKTPEMEEFIRNKISKKISRANKPNIISKIGLQKVEMGDGAPFITNPRLKDLTVDGNCCVEANLHYTGNFRLVISATVRIDLGSRFKAREVDILLSVVLKKLEGHMFMRFKPPPSNRIWVSFESMPNMVMDIQPIVSSKQITYGIILRTIESKIREILAESMVQPFWDDIPFLNTASQAFRGGIWERDIPKPGSKADIPDESLAQAQTPGETKEDSIELLKSKDDRTMSMPVLSERPASLKPRKGRKPSLSELQGSWNESSSAVEKQVSPTIPRAIRSQMPSNAADPVVTADNVKVDNVKYNGQGDERTDATSAMMEINSRSLSESPDKNEKLQSFDGPLMPESVVHSRKPSIVESVESMGGFSQSSLRGSSSPYLRGDSSMSYRSVGGSPSASLAGDKSRSRNTLENFTKSFSSMSSEDKEKGSLSFGNATAAARKWGWNVFGKGEHNTGPNGSRPAGTPEQPIGRGHPLPPPGTPLPHPDKFTLKRSSTSHMPKRKPVPPALPERPTPFSPEQKRPVPKPPLPKRKPIVAQDQAAGQPEELLVVEAPEDSGPSTPADLGVDGDLIDLDIGESPQEQRHELSLSDDPQPSTGDQPPTGNGVHSEEDDEEDDDTQGEPVTKVQTPEYPGLMPEIQAVPSTERDKVDPAGDSVRSDPQG